MIIHKKSMKMKAVSLILAITVGIPFFSALCRPELVRASTNLVKDMSNTRLGVNGLSNPRVPTSSADAWNGSYVYFGRYKGRPIRFRVLDKTGTSPYQGLFLDCASWLYTAAFDADSSAWNSSDCDIRNGLNGSQFLKATSGFTYTEEASIRTQEIASHPLTGINDYAMTYFKNFNEILYIPSIKVVTKVFLLDAEDIFNPKYGYIDNWGEPDYTDNTTVDYHWEEIKNHQKGGDYPVNWWIRSKYGTGGYVGMVASKGYMFNNICDEEAAVSPALSVDLSSILFSTVIDGNYGYLGSEYKLTLIDDSFILSITKGQKTSINGRTITIPYTEKESNRYVKANSFSFMILDKEYVNGNTNNAKLLYYGHADEDVKNESGNGGTAYCIIPESFDLSKWGKDYFVYFFEEELQTRENNALFSDYASVPVKLARPSDYVTKLNFTGEYTIQLNKRQSDACMYLLKNGMVKASPIENNTVRFDLDGDGIYDCILFTNADRKNCASRFTNSPISGRFTYDVSKCSGSYLNKVQFIFEKPKPPAPTGLKGSADTSTSVKLTWDKASYASEYEVYRSTSANGTYSKLGSVTETNRRCPGLTAGTRYYFKVRSVMIINSVKYYSDFTSPISVVPPLTAPGGVKATVSSNTAVTVSWDAVKGATGYVVYRATSENGTYTRLGTVTGTSRKCTGLTGGKKYYFKVRAIVTYDGTTYYGKFSSPVSAIPPLPKPSYINVIPGATSTSALVYWNEVKGATGYVVYRSTSENGTYTRLGTVKTTDRTCTGLKKGQTYYFKVRAINVVDGTTCYGSYTAPVKYTVK